MRRIIDCLHEYAQNGDLDGVKLALGEGADINSRDKDSNTLLITAIQNRHSKLALFLIKNGADIGIKGKCGSSPLLAAALNRLPNVAKYLLEMGADSNIVNDVGVTPLLAAAHKCDSPLVEMLLAAGAKVDAAQNDGLTPLMAAMAKGNVQIVETLLHAGADPARKRKKDGLTALALAANYGQTEAIECLAQIAGQRALADVPLIKLFVLGAFGQKEENCEDVCLKLLDCFGLPEGSSAFFGGNNAKISALGAAISKNFIKATKSLIDIGADPDSRMFSDKQIAPLTWAFFNKNQKLAKLLIEAGASIDHSVELFLLLSKDQEHEWFLMNERGFRPDSTMGRDLVNARVIINNHPKAGKEGWAKSLAKTLPHYGGETIENQLQFLMQMDPSLIKKTPISDQIKRLKNDLSECEKEKHKYALHLIDLFHIARDLPEKMAQMVAAIVTKHYAGVPKKRSEIDKAKGRILIDLCSAIVKFIGDEHGLYEDDKITVAIAEYVLWGSPYSMLAKSAEKTKTITDGPQEKGAKFEKACADMLSEAGFTVRLVAASGDQGADIIAKKDDQTYAVQCKHYDGAVGNAAVQQAVAARLFYSTDHSVVVSCNGFTSAARELAAKSRVLLIKEDGLRHMDTICGAMA